MHMYQLYSEFSCTAISLNLQVFITLVCDYQCNLGCPLYERAPHAHTCIPHVHIYTKERCAHLSPYENKVMVFSPAWILAFSPCAHPTPICQFQFSSWILSFPVKSPRCETLGRLVFHCVFPAKTQAPPEDPSRDQLWEAIQVPYVS